jgi:hypothetical protein
MGMSIRFAAILPDGGNAALLSNRANNFEKVENWVIVKPNKLKSYQYYSIV